MEKIKTLLIPVIYNSYEKCIDLLKSITNLNNLESLRIILVDNSEKESNFEFEKFIQTLNLNIEYVKTPFNLGYFGGAQYALGYYQELHPLPDYIIVCNVDIMFKQKDFFVNLYKESLESNVGIIAPSIISIRWGTDSNPQLLKKISSKKIQFLKLISSNCVFINLYQISSYVKKIVGKKDKKKLCLNQTQIYAPHGSIIIFRKIYFSRGGDLKHISFLFGEEIFLAEMAIKLNLKIIYLSSLKIFDFEHVSTGILYSKKICKYLNQSIKDIIKHYYQF